MESFIQYIANGIMQGGVYALIALGIVLIYKSTGVFNFAVGQMMLFGAFFFWTFVEKLGLPAWIGLVGSLACGAILGLLAERLVLRPLIGQPILSSVLITLALSYFLGGSSLAIWGAYQGSLPEFLPLTSSHLGGIVLPADLIWSFALALVIFAILVVFYQRSRLGLAMRATAESHQIAQARGINVRNIFSVTWAIAGAIATVAGIILGYRMGLGSFLAMVGLRAFPAVLLGGLDSIPGAIIGGLIVGILENLANGYTASWIADITPYVILVLVLIFRPQGLFGLKRIERI